MYVLLLIIYIDIYEWYIKIFWYQVIIGVRNKLILFIKDEDNMNSFASGKCFVFP